MDKLKLQVLSLWLLQLILSQDMLVVFYQVWKWSLLMSQKWTIMQLIRMSKDILFLEVKSALVVPVFSNNITNSPARQRKLLMKKDGCTLEILESCYPMVPLKLLTERKIFSNWVKVNTLHLKKLKIFMLELEVLLKLFSMEILSKTSVLVLLFPTLKKLKRLLQNLMLILIAT